MAFIFMLMAGIGLKGEDLHLLRTRLIGESYGLSDKDTTKRTEIYKGMFPHTGDTVGEFILGSFQWDMLSVCLVLAQ